MGLAATKKGKKKSIGRKTDFLSDKVKPIDLSKFVGKLEWKGDPLKVQKQLRNE